MTSTAYLEMEITAHSAIAVAGRMQLARETAGFVAGVCATVAYVPFQVFRIWRKMRFLAELIEGKRPLTLPTKQLSETDLQHALTSLGELHTTVHNATSLLRSTGLPRFACGPMLGAIERDNQILGDFIEDAEMCLSKEFRESLQGAIAELKPPTGVDWKTSLESMRN